MQRLGCLCGRGMSQTSSCLVQEAEHPQWNAQHLLKGTQLAHVQLILV